MFIGLSLALTQQRARGSGGGAPSYLGVGDTTFALYTVDAALAEGDVVDGADLAAEDPSIGPYAYYASVPTAPAFPVVIGTPLTGTWRAVQPIPSASMWGGAIGGYFTRVT